MTGGTGVAVLDLRGWRHAADRDGRRRQPERRADGVLADRFARLDCRACSFCCNADFVGATQLLIYVGGTVVLLIFGVMLTASGPYLKIKTSPARRRFLRRGIGVLFLAMMFGDGVLRVDWDSHVDGARRPAAQPAPTVPRYNARRKGNTARPLGLALLGLRPDKDLGSTPRIA